MKRFCLLLHLTRLFLWTFFPEIILVNRNCVGILCTQMTQFGMLLPSVLGSILTANNSVQDASALHLGSIWAPSSLQYLSLGCFCPPSGLHPHCQYLSPGCFCPHFWAPSSLPNTSIQDASVLTSGLHPHCQIPQFRMLLSSLLGSILTAKYLSSGCFCPHFWAPSSLPNTSVQDASVLTSGLHPHCQIPQFRMLLSSLLGSILTAKYLSSGCFCPHFWAPSSLQESLLTTNLPLACVYYLIRPPMSASTLLNRGE